MKTKVFYILIALSCVISSCSNSVEYSEEFKKQTTGNYLYNLDDMIEVYYEDNTLYLNWRNGVIEPVALSENEFFVADMYKKLHFVTHPETKERYLSIINEEDESIISYDYKKVNDGYKTPSAHLEAGNYEEALTGYLKIKAQDSTSSFISERDFNRLGYKQIAKHDLDKAIEIFKINTILHPNSANVFDSLAQAYLVSGDSLQACVNYKKTLKLNTGNRRAQKFIENCD